MKYPMNLLVKLFLLLAVIAMLFVQVEAKGKAVKKAPAKKAPTKKGKGKKKEE